MPQPGVHQASVQPGGDLQDAVSRLGAPLCPRHQEGNCAAMPVFLTAVRLVLTGTGSG